ncbi:N-acetylneuraminate synthase [Halomonas sp. BC04]|uniref:N-acetylneuraminate synthase n=1 Tax=Halomonas sp. BC04 TaxID=1403540 RepID=UPI0003ED7F9D|nr:N-acetylneuraminate synthase [Halomonas sp. BC04]EWH00309.1 hypothetical protein Q427_20250 [Halomonas sp. BC04]
MIEPSATFVIAEAGVNHNGSLEMAIELVDAAKRCGADAVKFQTFKADTLVTKHAAKAAYQCEAVLDSNGQYGMLKALELTDDDFMRLNAHCNQHGIEFLSSAFDVESAIFLNGLGMRLFKIPSGEITNWPLLDSIGAFGKPVILSTGMCYLADVEVALQRLEMAGAGEITVLHCVTEYPAPYSQVNLSAMRTLADAFGVKVGYSDHTAGTEISIAAVAMGAAIIEKHFTLDTRLPGPDHAASLAPDDFQRMVTAIRHVESARGNGRKRPAPCERPNLDVVRKSITVQCPISEGEVITLGHLA